MKHIIGLITAFLLVITSNVYAAPAAQSLFLQVTESSGLGPDVGSVIEGEMRYDTDDLNELADGSFELDFFEIDIPGSDTVDPFINGATFDSSNILTGLDVSVDIANELFVSLSGLGFSIEYSELQFGEFGEEQVTIGRASGNVLTAPPVPVPGAALLFLSGLAGLGLRKRLG